MDVRERHGARLAEARAQLGGACVRCGSVERLEFDHIDASTKRADVTRSNGWSDDTFWQEVAKCQLLCRPCHVDKTRDEGGFRGSSRPVSVHGTAYHYRVLRCRCDECRAANAARERVRAQRARARAQPK